MYQNINNYDILRLQDDVTQFFKVFGNWVKEKDFNEVDFIDPYAVVGVFTNDLS